MTEPSSDLDPRSAVSVGRIGAPHGVKGDISVQPLTDFPERFDAGQRVWLDGEPRRIERSRWQGRSVVIKLEGVDERNGAEALRGKELMLPEAQPLPEAGVFYQHDVIGLKVEDSNGELLGQLADILSTGANDVYVVRGERGELLLPAVEDVVRQIDVTGGRVVVDLLPGLEFKPASRPKPRKVTTPGAAKPRKATTPPAQEPSQ